MRTIKRDFLKTKQFRAMVSIDDLLLLYTIVLEVQQRKLKNKNELRTTRRNI